MEKPGRETTLNDERAELRALREVGVEVERIVIAGELGEGPDMLLGKRQRTLRTLTDDGALKHWSSLRLVSGCSSQQGRQGRREYR
jgi:hypothetical protein